MYVRDEYMKRIDNNRVRIIDLIRYYIKKWKLLVMIFLAFFLICMAFIFRNYQKEPVISKPLEMENLKEEQRERVGNILKLYEELENIGTYKKEAACMELNAYDCNITVIQYLILPKASSSGLKLYDLYANFIKNGRLKTTLEDELGGKIKYPSDLVTLVEQIIPKNFLVPDQYILSIKINASDLEESKEITEVVKREIVNYCQEVAMGIDDHSLKLVSEDSYIGVDYDLREQQDQITKDYESKRQQILNLENLLSSEEKNVLEIEKGDIIEQATVPHSGFSWMFIIIAFFASLVLACMVIAIYFVYCDKVKLPKEVVTLFDIPLFGEICEEMSVEEAKILEEELLLHCDCLAIKRVFVSQLNSDDSIKLEAITDSLNDNGIKMIIGGNICENIEAVKKAIECKNLIMVYQLDKTTYNDLDNLFQKCSSYGINVVGAICKK
ncbi:MAG: hypothetical protein HFG28_07965 [Eubacterium sp.]|nr:hypothetical protein [Eubacterium sp.]